MFLWNRIRNRILRRNEFTSYDLKYYDEKYLKKVAARYKSCSDEHRNLIFLALYGVREARDAALRLHLSGAITLEQKHYDKLDDDEFGNSLYRERVIAELERKARSGDIDAMLELRDRYIAGTAPYEQEQLDVLENQLLEQKARCGDTEAMLELRDRYIAGTAPYELGQLVALEKQLVELGCNPFDRNEGCEQPQP